MLHALVRAETPNPLLPADYDIIWSAVIFVIVLAAFTIVFLPKVQKMLDERGAAIEGNIAKADEAQREAEAALEQYTAQLAEARIEAASIRENAREDGKKIVLEAKEQATADAERITLSAQARIEADRQAAVTSLRGEVGTLALDLASGVVGEALGEDARSRSVVDRFLADLEASSSTTEKA